MAKLVVFYSRADENYFGGSCRYIAEGNTEKVARMIAASAGADLFKIEQKVPYAADYNTCIEQAKKDLRAKARPELVSMPESLDNYDEIYLGYPNYWGDMPMAVYTFLESHDFAGKTIVPFCTHAGSGLSSTVSSIQTACPDATVLDGFSIQGSTAQNDQSNANEAVIEWLKKNGFIE